MKAPDMKTIGLIGGMSWESSNEYVKIMNETVREKLGGLNSAEIASYCVNFAPIERLMGAGKWKEIGKIMVLRAKKVEMMGAESLVICTNTMHKFADLIQANIGIPLLHIADAAGKKIRDSGFKNIGLLGTIPTMEGRGYSARLEKASGAGIMIPNFQDREIVHRVIFDELCKGNVQDTSREKFKRIIWKMEDGGAEAVVLGCTEIFMLVKQKDVKLPLLDTTRIHAQYAVAHALGEIPSPKEALAAARKIEMAGKTAHTDARIRTRIKS